MYKIAIIEEFHKAGLRLFDQKKNFSYEVIKDVSDENLIKKLPSFDGCTLRISKLTSNILKHCKKLKVISRHGVGYNNVDLDYIKKNNITLLITNNANHISVAEHVMYMMLTISKGFLSHDRSVRDGLFNTGIKDIQTFELSGKNMLIIGFGRIGRALINKCKSFNMKVSVYDPYVDEKLINSFGGKKINRLDDTFKDSDFISLHVPLTHETKNMINMNNIKLMKSSCVIINTARGGVINENDLDEALRKNMVFGAGIDVFESEPVSSSHPFINNKKILLSPHSATWTNECKIRMAELTAQNIIDFFEKKIDKSMLVKL